MSKHEQMKAYRAAKVEHLVKNSNPVALAALVFAGQVGWRMQAEVLDRWAA